MLKEHLTRDENTEIVGITTRARNMLIDAGINFSERRFPYTYHHDNAREVLGRGGEVGRSEVAAALEAWAIETGDKRVHLYAWTAIQGAMEYLTNLGEEMPEQLVEETKQALHGVNHTFAEYFRDLRAPPASPLP